MTTVIVNTDKGTIWADTQNTVMSWKGGNEDGSTLHSTITHKIFETERGILSGAGDGKMLKKCAQQFADTGILPDPVDYDTRVVIIFGTKSCCKAVVYNPVKKDKIFSRLFLGKYKWKKQKFKGVKVIGSGTEYAEGALAAGASEEDAIKAVSKVDFYTNDKVESRSLPYENV